MYIYGFGRAMSQQERFSELIKKRVRIDDVFFYKLNFKERKQTTFTEQMGKQRKKATSGLKRRNKSCL
jgi:hypothetical protein